MRFLTRMFFDSARALQLGSTLLHNCAGATLTLAELRADIHDRWQTFYDTTEDVLRGLRPWETALADRLAAPGASVLVVGCGSGREILGYLERGCRVTGIDPAERVLDVARRTVAEHGFSAELIQGFIDDAEVPGRYDVVLFGWGCYAQIPVGARRARTLTRLAAQLNPGGRIALAYDVQLRPRAIVVAAARLAGTLARSDWRVEPGDKLEWRQFGSGEPFFGYEHSFVPEEIEREAAAAGLRISYRCDPPDQPVYILEPRS
jgi:SAM-dependent methyltransferase